MRNSLKLVGGEVRGQLRVLVEHAHQLTKSGTQGLGPRRRHGARGRGHACQLSAEGVAQTAIRSVGARTGGHAGLRSAIMGAMPDDPSTRSVKIGADERTGWSSERPRRDGAPPRPADISEKCRVLPPTDRMRYSPGSLVVIAGPAAVSPERFAERVVEERSAVLSAAKVRALLEGRVAPEELPERAAQLLDAAVLKRLAARQSVVVPVQGLDPGERERFVRPAHAARRPRHLILIDGSRDQVTDAERPLLDELRRALDASELGREGFQTAMRLGGQTRDELKRIVFARPPADN